MRQKGKGVEAESAKVTIGALTGLFFFWGGVKLGIGKNCKFKVQSITIVKLLVGFYNIDEHSL